MDTRQKANGVSHTKNKEQSCSKMQSKEKVYKTIKKERKSGYMRRKGYKILPLIIIVILALMCMLYCIFNFLIFQEIKEKVTTEGMISFKMMSDVINIMAIAVSVWIGLNIYNIYKKTDIDNILEELKENNYRMNYEYQRRKFILQLERTEEWYEISEYFGRCFEYEDEIPLAVWDRLCDIEKSFVRVCKAYEKKKRKIQISAVKEAEQLLSVVEYTMEHGKGIQNTLLGTYIDIRKADLLFYKNHPVNWENQKFCEKELLESVLLYEKHEDLKKKDNKIAGYMANTIGFSNLLLMQNVQDIPLKKQYYEEAEKELEEAINSASKGRYYQNKGALYEQREKLQQAGDIVAEEVDYYEKAYKCYKDALSAENMDSKIYNLLGSVCLKRFEKRTGIDKRFSSDGKLLYERKGEILEEEDKALIKEAYNWMLLGLQVQEPIINTYYNLAKACMYYWLFVEVDMKEMQIKGEQYLEIVKALEPENQGYLFTQRNYYEAQNNIEKALEINKSIRGGDTELAKKRYQKYIKAKTSLEKNS